MTNNIIYIALITLLFLFSCESKNIEVDSEKSKETTAIVATEEDSPPAIAVPADNRTTLEGFWAIFQKAVVDRDIETLESLYSAEAVTYKFGDENYQEQIKNGTASNIEDSGEEKDGKKVYSFTMTIPLEGEGEQSETTIYIIKNTEGNFEIFNVLEAG